MSMTARSESSNARQGIKTILLLVSGAPQIESESSNARQGIKTAAAFSGALIPVISPNHRMPVRALRPAANWTSIFRLLSVSESSNARQGIKTQSEDLHKPMP